MQSRKTAISLLLAVALAPYLERQSTHADTESGQGTPVVARDDPHRGLQATSCEESIATQNRINRYFHRAVVPGMASCWSRIGGAGTVAVRFEYRRADERWTSGDSRIRSSTLPRGQDELALRCLQDAVRDTSFAVDPSDEEAQEFNVNWSFPVPWPNDLTAAALRMIDNGGGGGAGDCGGSEGPAPACWDCYYIPVVGWSFCGYSCAGYIDCTPTTSGCNHTNVKCITGSVFGNIGGVMLYEATDIQR